jgi:hypothetical protein
MSEPEGPDQEEDVGMPIGRMGPDQEEDVRMLIGRMGPDQIARRRRMR